MGRGALSRHQGARSCRLFTRRTFHAASHVRLAGNIFDLPGRRSLTLLGRQAHPENGAGVLQEDLTPSRACLSGVHRDASRRPCRNGADLPGCDAGARLRGPQARAAAVSR